MSHSVKVTMIADQIIFINGTEINVHDISVIEVDGHGLITSFWPAQQSAHWTLRLWVWLKNCVG